MKTVKINLFAIFATAILFSACSGLRVISDKDNTVDFNAIKSYQFIGWADNSDQLLNRFDKERIEMAFANEAGRRGLLMTQKDPDVLAAIFVIGETKTQKTATTNTNAMNMGGMGMGMGMAGGMRHPGWGWGGGMTMAQSHTVINERSYIEGTLMIELFDPDEKKLIWQAIGRKTVSEDPKKRQKDIPKKVSAIMSKYPVKPLK